MSRPIGQRLEAGYGLLAQSDDSYEPIRQPDTNGPMTDDETLRLLELRTLSNSELSELCSQLRRGYYEEVDRVARQTLLSQPTEEPQNVMPTIKKTARKQPLYVTSQSKGLLGTDEQQRIKERLELARQRLASQRRLITRQRCARQHPKTQYFH